MFRHLINIWPQIMLITSYTRRLILHLMWVPKVDLQSEHTPVELCCRSLAVKVLRTLSLFVRKKLQLTFAVTRCFDGESYSYEIDNIHYVSEWIEDVSCLLILVCINTTIFYDVLYLTKLNFNQLNELVKIPKLTTFANISVPGAIPSFDFGQI